MAQSTDTKDDIRESWTVNSKVEVFSSSSKKWHKGSIKQIVTDEEGEWLEVTYKADNAMRVKQCPREDVTSIRPYTISKQKDAEDDDCKNESINDDDEKENKKNKKTIKKITLNIKTMTNEQFTVSVKYNISVETLKKEIYKASHTKINPLLQKLMYSGKILNDEQKLNDSQVNIKDKFTIILVKQSPKQMVITLKTLQSKFYDLEICNIDTIAQIKESIYKKIKIAKPKNLQLIYNGIVLKDEQTAQSAQLKEKK
eukprot:531025_1